jgi:hypothetical protein
LWKSFAQRRRSRCAKRLRGECATCRFVFFIKIDRSTLRPFGIYEFVYLVRGE